MGLGREEGEGIESLGFIQEFSLGGGGGGGGLLCSVLLFVGTVHLVHLIHEIFWGRGPFSKVRLTNKIMQG